MSARSLAILSFLNLWRKVGFVNIENTEKYIYISTSTSIFLDPYIHYIHIFICIYIQAYIKIYIYICIYIYRYFCSELFLTSEWGVVEYKDRSICLSNCCVQDWVRASLKGRAYAIWWSNANARPTFFLAPRFSADVCPLLICTADPRNLMWILSNPLRGRSDFT